MRPIVAAGGLLWARDRRAEALEVLDGLSSPNPAYGPWAKRRETMRFPGPEPPRRVSCGGDIPAGSGGPWDGGVWMPRFTPGVQADSGRMVAPVAEEAALQVDLRPYQRDALDAWLSAGRAGTVCAPCGGGKTVIGLAAMAATPTPALVLVHTLDLARQWIGEAREKLGVEAGLVGDGKRKDTGRVTVATLQTLSRWPWWERAEWGRRYGLVICDECHHIPAVSFAEVLSTLPGKARLGLTATPERHDGLTEWVWWCCGPLVRRITQGELQALGAVLAPVVRWVPSPWTAPDVAGWADIMADLAGDETRNRLLERLIVERVQAGRSVIVLADRVEHCYELARRVCAAVGEGAAEALVGEVTPKRRTALLERARTGALRCVVATTVADEGLDLPRLDCVVLAAPSKNLGRVQQRVGRALRPMSGKGEPEVVDVVDAWGPCQGWARKRVGLYHQLGWRVCGAWR